VSTTANGEIRKWQAPDFLEDGHGVFLLCRVKGRISDGSEEQCLNVLVKRRDGAS